MNSVCEVVESNALLARLVSISLMVLKTFLTFVITSLHLFIAEISEKGANNGDEKATQADNKGDGGVS
jgi:hypothetical protein